MEKISDNPIKLIIPDMESARVVVREGGLVQIVMNKETWSEIRTEIIKTMSYEMMEGVFVILEKNGVEIVLE